MTRTDTYRVNHLDLTVDHIDTRGEPHDMNAYGAPCTDTEDLRAFITELCEQGAFGADVRDQLHADL